MLTSLKELRNRIYSYIFPATVPLAPCMTCDVYACRNCGNCDCDFGRCTCACDCNIDAMVERGVDEYEDQLPKLDWEADDAPENDDDIDDELFRKRMNGRRQTLFAKYRKNKDCHSNCRKSFEEPAFLREAIGINDDLYNEMAHFYYHSCTMVVPVYNFSLLKSFALFMEEEPQRSDNIGEITVIFQGVGNVCCLDAWVKMRKAVLEGCKIAFRASTAAMPIILNGCRMVERFHKAGVTGKLMDFTLQNAKALTPDESLHHKEYLLRLCDNVDCGDYRVSRLNYDEEVLKRLGEGYHGRCGNSENFDDLEGAITEYD